MPPTINCFEFFGFDVLIDNTLRPWLLEVGKIIVGLIKIDLIIFQVNLSPALGNDCDVDRSVKKPMLHDMLDLLGLPLYNTGLAVFNVWSDDVKENNKSNDENDKDDVSEIGMLSNNRTLNVVTAAGKWRRKQKKSASRANSAVKNTKTRTPSARTSKDINLLL